MDERKTSGLRMLLVEDNDADAALLEASLGAMDRRFEIVRATNLGDAERALESEFFDAVLLDLTLPDSTAEETLARMQAFESKVAVIVLTGIDDDEVCSHIVQQGAQDYVPKSEICSTLMRRTIEHSVERFRNAQKLALARQDALAASRAKSNFVSAMSHEIRTPLNAILGMAELLGSSDLDDQQREYVRVFQRSGRSLLSLINSVLDLASIERGKFELAHGAFSVREFVEETAETFAFEAHKKRLGFSVEVLPEVPEVVIGDVDRLRQVLANLLGNAIKFTSEGQVSVRVERRPDGVLRFEVHDSGIGIVADKLDKIFEPFEQGEHDPSHVYGGTGLGLALCREFVSRMEGTIRAEQAPEGGAIVWFEVALEVQREATSFVSGAPAPRVLVAMSSAQEREVVMRFCERAGAEVVAVAGVAGAMTCIESSAGAFDLLIVDCRLPENGGLSLLEYLSARSDAPRSLVLLPMDHRPSDMQTCREYAATALIKPVREKRLREWLVGTDVDAMAGDERSGARLCSERLAGMRVLYADDSADNRLLVEAYLRDLGCRLTEVADGVEAVETYTAGEFDVVLMDIQMPRMNGLDATRRIREFEKQEERDPTPILALTANAFVEQAELCLEAGANRHLAKPLERAVLIEALSEFAPETKEEDVPKMDLSGIDPDIADLVPGYLERRLEEVHEMRDALVAEDFDVLRRLAHNLKGTGGGYGLPLLTQLGARLENAASALDERTSAHEIDDLESLVGHALETLNGPSASAH